MDGYPIATPISQKCTAADDLYSIVGRLKSVLDSVNAAVDRVSAVTSLDWYSPAGSKFRDYVEDQRRQLRGVAAEFQDAIATVSVHAAETSRLRMLQDSAR